MSAPCASALLLRAGSSSCLSSGDLSWKCERVGEKKLSKACELGDFFRAQLIVVMRSLIAIKPDQVRPLLQVIGQLPSLMKGINSWREVLSREAAIELSGGNVESLPIHGCRSVGMASGCVIRSLRIRPLDGWGDVLWNLHSLWCWVNFCYHRSPRSAFGTKLPVTLSDPAVVECCISRCDADQVIAGITAKYDSGIFSAWRRCHHITHSHRLGSAVRAGIYEGICHE